MKQQIIYFLHLSFENGSSNCDEAVGPHPEKLRGWLAAEGFEREGVPTFRLDQAIRKFLGLVSGSRRD